MIILNKQTGKRIEIIDNTAGGTSSSRLPFRLKSFGGISMETSTYHFTVTDTSTVSNEPS